MKFKNLLTATLTLFVTVTFIQAEIYPREDTLYIPEALILPEIDGLTEDEAWELIDWQPIDHTWIPWGQEIAPSIFQGKFKVTWSSQTNLLYFLVDIHDDVFVDGYEFPNSGYPDFDIVEVFIDEDRSGGPHVWDDYLWDGNSRTSCPTCNAENAFSYHLAANAPQEGEVQNNFYALDIAGTNWGTIRDYASHFPEFALRKNGDNYIWEFSMIVHNDTYDHNNQSASEVTLYVGKVMGLTMAYCNNDTPGTTRDHFFGSVNVPQANYNDHWINADWFGVAKLTENPSTSIPSAELQEATKTRVFTANQQLHIHINSPFNESIHIRVVNILGSEVFSHSAQKSSENWNASFHTENLPKGIYVIEVIHGNSRKVQKVSL